MLQVARDKVVGYNKFVVGIDLVQWTPIHLNKGEVFWIAKDEQSYTELCAVLGRKVFKDAGIRLKPGEGPIDIKIVRVDQ